MAENQKDRRVPAFVFFPVSSRTRTAFGEVQNTLKPREAHETLLKPQETKPRARSFSSFKSEIQIDKLKAESKITVRRDAVTSTGLDVAFVAKGRPCKCTKENLAPPQACTLPKSESKTGSSIQKSTSSSSSSPSLFNSREITVVPNPNKKERAERQLIVAKRRMRSVSTSPLQKNDFATKTKKEFYQTVDVVPSTSQESCVAKNIQESFQNRRTTAIGCSSSRFADYESTTNQCTRKILPQGGYRNWSPIRPNNDKSAAFINEFSIVRREPKIKKLPREVYVGDIFSVDYLEDIYAMMRVKERYVMLEPNFINRLNPSVTKRSLIINWLLSMQKAFHFTDVDYFMTVRLFDVMLAAVTVPTNIYQLLCTTCLWIVSKINGPTFKALQILSMCGNAFTTCQLYSMEMKVLRVTGFHLTTLEPTLFVNYYLKKLNVSHHMIINSGVLYILDCLTLEPTFSTMQLSEMAASAINYVLYKLKQPAINFNLNPDHLNMIMKLISKQLFNMSDENYIFKAPFQKYFELDRNRVSRIITY